MHDLGPVVLILLLAVAGLAALARVVRVPYPITLVLGGLALGFVPGVPRVQLEPDLVLLLFLPPLLYAAAFFSSLRDLRANVGSISLLSIGLVAATMAGVAAAGHFALGLSWPVAFVLGAVVSPTDAVAPAAIVRRLGVPRRIVTVIEGENLTNDWTALVLYRVAVGAVVAGSFSLPKAALALLLTGLGGLVIGLLVGWLVAQVRRRIDDPPTEMAISLTTAYAAYIPAEELGASGVIAAVTVGVYLGWRTPRLVTPSTRLQLHSAWEMLQFLLNAVLFVLVGFQLPTIIAGLDGVPAARLIGQAALVCAVVVAVRLAWVFTVMYAPRGAERCLRSRRERHAPPAHVAIVAWSGMRGAVALAAALAIPLSVEGGDPFPQRDLLVFLAFATVVGTLVIQGITLPWLVRALGVEGDGRDEREESAARVRAAEAGLARVDELADADWTHEATVERLRGLFDLRRRRFAARADGDGSGDEAHELRSAQYVRLMRETIGAQRMALLDLRDGGEISDEVMRRVERELDLEESRLGA
ncbi:MAG TPA: Na+/H+ antiporter [Thermoleophilaceae bacterium]|nr:Na+/H+ antiporter [Thermoleophilaceae bacterium]